MLKNPLPIFPIIAGNFLKILISWSNIFVAIFHQKQMRVWRFSILKHHVRSQTTSTKIYYLRNVLARENSHAISAYFPTKTSKTKIRDQNGLKSKITSNSIKTHSNFWWTTVIIVTHYSWHPSVYFPATQSVLWSHGIQYLRG